MNPKQVASALTYAGALIVPRGWLLLIAPMLTICITAVVLVISTERNQRVAAITALVPALTAFASRSPTSRNASDRP